MLKIVPDLFDVHLNPSSDVPIYRQLADSFGGLILRDALRPGERLPATRELAGRLGLNRTTVAAAYALLEESGLISGHVGRGSFVAKRVAPPARSTQIEWESVLPPLEPRVGSASARHIEVNFATARPSREAFPMAAFRRLTKQVIDGPEAAEILQLGSPFGYGPLRRYLLDQAFSAGVARASDDLIITNGCQQALDLLARLLASRGETVVLEDPVYYGLIRVFKRAGARMLSVPVDDSGVDVFALENIFRQEAPRLFVVTPSFQNPTGGTLPLARRKRVVELAQQYGVILVENDIYTELRYEGSRLPTLKQLDETGNSILLGSYSKVSFPGLRVGWAIAPRPVIARLVEAKQTSDLHSDHLSQAVLLRFAESGELARHLDRTRADGRERLRTALAVCGRYLPPGSRFTRPEGGMNFWIELPAPLTADGLLSRVQEKGVSFLPGRYFSAVGGHVRGLRMSFGGLSPEQIVCGIQILGEAATSELVAIHNEYSAEPAAALV